MRELALEIVTHWLDDQPRTERDFVLVEIIEHNLTRVRNEALVEGRRAGLRVVSE